MLTDWMLRLRSLFRRRDVDQELDEEVRFHLEQQLELYVSQGLTREEARRRVSLEFGGLDQIKEEHRDARGVGVLTHLGRDLQHAVRQARRAPAFTAVAVVCLGLGIGVNTSIFAVLNAVMFRAMPVEDPERLVVLSRGLDAQFSYATYQDFLERTRTLSGLTASLPYESDLDIDGESQFVAAEAVSGNYAAVIGARTATGRWFTRDTDPVAVISHTVWQRRFGLDPNVIGKTVRSESQSYTIVGVASPDYNGIFSPLRTDLWVPLKTRPSLVRLTDDRTARRFMMFGRLAEAATAAQASIELNAIDAQVTAEQGLRSETSSPIVAEHVRGIANPGSRRRTQVVAAFLSVVVGLVLLIACVNVGHLLLVRGAVRQREFAVRRAVGASRGRLLQQLLTESLVVALAGGMCGLVFAHWTNATLTQSLPLVQGVFPIQLDFSFDWRVIGYATLISLGTTVLCGLMPAWRASRTSALVAFKGEIAVGTPRTRPFGLVAQVVMSFVLLLISGTFIQAVLRMQSADPGFAVAGRLYAYAYISTPGITPADARQIYSNALERLRALPAVRTATMTSVLPLMPSGSECVSIPKGTRLPVTSAAVEPGYFDTMDIAMVAGRDFALRETSRDAFSIVINERLAGMLWPRSSAVGERVLVGCEDTQSATVIGVVRNSAVRSLGETAAPHLYFSFARQYEGGLTAILLETTTPPGAMVQPVRRTLVELGQGMRVYTVQPLADHVATSYASIRWQASMLTAFGLLALALAAVGLSGVIAYRVTLRTREIGVRMALGAGRLNVFREVVGQGLSIAVIGVVIGEVLTIGLVRVLAAVDADIRPPGLIVLAATGIVWMAVAVLATYVPAARASRVNPIVALRYE
jgi:putative ABC transport system permease protein